MSEALRGRVVVVTGASSGIGAATAKMLSGEGAKVALVSRTASPMPPDVDPEPLPPDRGVLARLIYVTAIAGGPSRSESVA